MRDNQLGEERLVLGIVHVRKRRTLLDVSGVEHGLGAAFNLVPLLFTGLGPDEVVVDDSAGIAVIGFEPPRDRAHPCVVEL